MGRGIGDDEHSQAKPTVGPHDPNGLQTVAPGPANKGGFQLTFRANKLRVKSSIAANEPTLFPAYQ
jgi:hypothetical protein